MPTSVACIIDGIEYPSISEAARQLNIKLNTVRQRIKSKNFPSYTRTSNDQC